MGGPHPGCICACQQSRGRSTAGSGAFNKFSSCASPSRLAKELAAMGHNVSRTVVGELLHARKFSPRGNRKALEGNQIPDRDAQFHHINASVTKAQAVGNPVISVDTKKKEHVGDFGLLRAGLVPQLVAQFGIQ